MPIDVRCQSCGKSFRGPDKLAGKRVKCPKCGGVIQVANVHGTIQPAQPERKSPQRETLPEKTYFEEGRIKVTSREFIYPVRGRFRLTGAVPLDMIQAVEAKRTYGIAIGWVVGIFLFLLVHPLLMIFCAIMAVYYFICPHYGLYITVVSERQKLLVRKRRLIEGVQTALREAITDTRRRG